MELLLICTASWVLKFERNTLISRCVLQIRSIVFATILRTRTSLPLPLLVLFLARRVIALGNVSNVAG